MNAHPEKQLLILPGAQNTLGGTLIYLATMIQGCKQIGKAANLKVLAWADSLLYEYMRKAGLEAYLQVITAENKQEFVKKALEWVDKQPRNYPLLLENCIERQLIPLLILAAPKLRYRRPVFFSFHDLGLSHNPLGYLARKIAFALLNPGAICNSNYTAGHIKSFTPNIKGVLYPPVNTEKFNSKPSAPQPPKAIQRFLKPGVKLMLTPSRIKLSGDMNDKNLFALLPVLAQLKARGHKYHAVIVGEDKTPNQIASRLLHGNAEGLNVADCFSIIPPTFEIENYYKYADVVVTLAPREPFGLTVVEALACGVPVIGSNTGGIAEILSHFAPQWTVDPQNPAQVADVIINTVENPNTAATIIQAQNWVKKECSLIACAQKVMEITGMCALRDEVAEIQQIAAKSSPSATLAR